MTKYGPWIIHQGDECPVAPDNRVQLITAIDDTSYRKTVSVRAEEVSWRPVFAYRVLRKSESEPYAVVQSKANGLFFYTQFDDGADWRGIAIEKALNENGFIRFYSTDGTLESTQWPE